MIMDITLERILSLLPHNEAGKIIHGERQKFAQSIGLRSGNVIADWISGRSSSYTDYIYQIAAVYDVSLDWLKGTTDDPTPPGVNSFDQAVLERVHALPPEQRRAFLLLIGLPEELLDALDREAPQE